MSCTSVFDTSFYKKRHNLFVHEKLTLATQSSTIIELNVLDQVRKPTRFKKNNRKFYFSRMNENISRSNEKYSRSNEKNSRSNENISRSNEKISRRNEKLSRRNENISRRNEKLSRRNEN